MLVRIVSKAVGVSMNKLYLLFISVLFWSTYVQALTNEEMRQILEILSRDSHLDRLTPAQSASRLESKWHLRAAMSALSYAQSTGNKPLHIAVIGGAGAGKSTTVQKILGSDFVYTGINPQAGFTRHGIGFVTVGKDERTHWDFDTFSHPFLKRYESLQLGEVGLSPDTDRDIYQIAKYHAAARPYLNNIVLWDMPDVTTYASEHYVNRVADILGFADVVIYVASDERYNDEAPTKILEYLARQKKFLAFVLTKANSGDAENIAAHFKNSVLSAVVYPGSEEADQALIFNFPNSHRETEQEKSDGKLNFFIERLGAEKEKLLEHAKVAREDILPLAIQQLRQEFGVLASERKVIREKILQITNAVVGQYNLMKIDDGSVALSELREDILRAIKDSGYFGGGAIANVQDKVREVGGAVIERGWKFLWGRKREEVAEPHDVQVVRDAIKNQLVEIELQVVTMQASPISYIKNYGQQLLRVFPRVHSREFEQQLNEIIETFLKRKEVIFSDAFSKLVREKQRSRRSSVIGTVQTGAEFLTAAIAIASGVGISGVVGYTLASAGATDLMIKKHVNDIVNAHRAEWQLAMTSMLHDLVLTNIQAKLAEAEQSTDMGKLTEALFKTSFVEPQLTDFKPLTILRSAVENPKIFQQMSCAQVFSVK